jgi:hypothetical protein
MQQWEAYRDPQTQQLYYYNTETGQTQWNPPTTLLSLNSTLDSSNSMNSNSNSLISQSRDGASERNSLMSTDSIANSSNYEKSTLISVNSTLNSSIPASYSLSSSTSASHSSNLISNSMILLPKDEILANWQAYRSPLHANELFFINSLTNERTWDRPFGFRGMPKEESESEHEKGPFVRYENEECVYYYNPRTKWVTRSRPPDKLVGSEVEVYETLKKLGEGVWEGRSDEELKREQEEEDDDSDSSGSSSSDEEEELISNFNSYLEEKGVTHISRWANWLPKLVNDPVFQTVPKDKARIWFENFVKEQVSKQSSGRSKAISLAKTLLIELVKYKGLTNAQSLYEQGTISNETQEALAALLPNEKTALLSSILKLRT